MATELAELTVTGINRASAGLVRQFGSAGDPPPLVGSCGAFFNGATGRKFAFTSRPKEGVGNAGCRLHPQPRVRFVLVESTRVNEYTGITRRSRTQWFYGLLRALPGDRACLTPSSADMFCLSPVG